MIKLKEVIQGNGTHTDEHGRLSAHKTNFTQSVTINPSQVVSVAPMPSMIVESEGEAPTTLCKVVTVNGTHIIVGSQSVIENRLLGDKRRILKG